MDTEERLTNHCNDRRRLLGAMLIGAGGLAAAGSPGVAHAQSTAGHGDHETPPWVIDRFIRIPNVPVGPYSDSLALDLGRKRLFATPQAAKSVAVIDLATGKVIRMMDGIGNPHGIIFDAKQDRLLVVDGAAGDLKVFSGKDYAPLKSIPLHPGADMAAYNPQTRTYYVNASGEGSGPDRSTISAIDIDGLRKTADIPIASAVLEGSVVDPDSRRLYVALREQSAVAAIDLADRRVVATWKMPRAEQVTWVMAPDAASSRLFVVCRNAVHETAMQGSIVVLDTRSGRVVQDLPIGGWADSIFIDRRRRRLYVSTGVGFVETYSIDGNDSYRRLPRVETAVLAKTSLYSPELDRLFVTVPRLGTADARIIVLKPA